MSNPIDALFVKLLCRTPEVISVFGFGCWKSHFLGIFGLQNAGQARKTPENCHLIAGERCLNSKLKSEGKDTKGKKAEEGSGDQDVDADVRQEKEVGEDEDADNSSKTAQLGDLNNFASFLEKEI